MTGEEREREREREREGERREEREKPVLFHLFIAYVSCELIHILCSVMALSNGKMKC
jgi:hypothetical protein